MTKANTKTNSGKLTKRDLFRANWRWLWGSQLSWNYERMMAPGYFYAVLPFLKRWYKDDELVEITPKSIRLRKKILDSKERERANRNK